MAVCQLRTLLHPFVYSYSCNDVNKRICLSPLRAGLHESQVELDSG